MKQRSIYEEIWRDETFANLSNTSKLLALYCLTNPNLKLIPVYKLTDREITFDTSISGKNLESAKKDLATIGIYFVDNFCILKTEFAVFKYKGPHLEKAKGTQYSEIPEKILEIVKSDTLYKGYQHPVDRVGDSDSDNDSDNEYEHRGIVKGGEKISNIYTSFTKLINPSSKLTKKAQDKIKARLKEYSQEQLEAAMQNFSNASWWMENNAHRGVAWFFHSDDRIDSFLNLKTANKNHQQSFKNEDLDQYKNIF